MDEFGSYRANSKDWDELAKDIKSIYSITFAYSADAITSYIITIAQTRHLGGFLPWGGQIDGMHLIALRRCGAEFFDLYSKKKLYPTYFSEKLGLRSISDAEQIAELLNALRERLSKTEEGSE